MATATNDITESLERIARHAQAAEEKACKHYLQEKYPEAVISITEVIDDMLEMMKQMENELVLQPTLVNYRMDFSIHDINSLRECLYLAYSKRAKIYLKRTLHLKVLEDIEYAEEFYDKEMIEDDRHAKMWNLRGIALECLSRYDEARCSYIQSNKLVPDEKVLTASTRTRLKLHQSRDGMFYDPSNFYLHGAEYLNPFCEYGAPSVHIQLLPNRDRGLVLRSNVVAGVVLLANTATAVGRYCSLSSLEESPCEDTNTLIRILCDYVKDMPERQHQLLSLQAHSRKDCVGPADPDISENTVARLFEPIRVFIKDQGGNLIFPDGTTSSKSSESYKMSVPSMDLLLPHRHHERSGKSQVYEETVPVDVLNEERITAIVALNGFDLHGQHGALAADLKCSPWDNRKQRGLWLLPSYLNHSCAPIISVIIVNKGMIVRAAREISTGEELTITYINPFQPVQCRQNSTFEPPWEFSCLCSRCSFEFSIDGPLEKITRLYQKFMDRIRFPQLLEHGIIEGDDADNPCRSVTFHLTTGMTASTFISELEDIMTKNGISENLQRSWIRASFLNAYRVQAAAFPNRPDETIEALKTIVEVVKTVSYSDVLGLKYNFKLLQEVRNYRGLGHEEFIKVGTDFVEVLRRGSV